MRLDKFIGKASYRINIHVSDYKTNDELFYLPDGDLYSDYEEDMKKYKVMYYTIGNNTLYVDVKKKED